MIHNEQKYVDVAVVKDGNYYSIHLIDETGTHYPISMVKSEGEAVCARNAELASLNKWKQKTL